MEAKRSPAWSQDPLALGRMRDELKVCASARCHRGQNSRIWSWAREKGRGRWWLSLGESVKGKLPKSFSLFILPLGQRDWTWRARIHNSESSSQGWTSEDLKQKQVSCLSCCVALLQLSHTTWQAACWNCTERKTAMFQVNKILEIGMKSIELIIAHFHSVKMSFESSLHTPFFQLSLWMWLPLSWSFENLIQKAGRVRHTAYKWTGMCFPS